MKIITKKEKISKQEQALRKLLLNKRFIARISEIKKAVGDPKFSLKVDYLLRDFDLPSYYRTGIVNFILFGKIPIHENSLVIHLKRSETTKQVDCMIQIFGDTTIEDIKRIWRDIKKIQRGEGDNIFHKPLPAYQKLYKAVPNLERDAEIRYLREVKRLSLKEISQKMGVDYQEIPKIISRHKKIIQE